MTKLADAYKRFTDGLAWLDAQPGSKAQLVEIRDNAVIYLNNAADSIAGKTKKCETHPTERAHNCGPCRSERIAARDWPEVDPDVAEVEARLLGEGGRHAEPEPTTEVDRDVRG